MPSDRASQKKHSRFNAKCPRKPTSSARGTALTAKGEVRQTRCPARGGARDLSESGTAITGAPPRAIQDRRPRGKLKHRQQQQQAQRAIATRHRQRSPHLIGQQQTVRDCATINGTVRGVVGVHCVATCTFLGAIGQTIHQFSIDFRQQSAVELSLSVG